MKGLYGDNEAKIRKFCSACRAILDEYRTKFESKTLIDFMEILRETESMDEILDAVVDHPGFKPLKDLLVLVSDGRSEDALIKLWLFKMSFSEIEIEEVKPALEDLEAAGTYH